MFASLRARLWLSYALLIGVVLFVVAVTLLWLYVRNPRLLYPEQVYRLRLTSETILERVQKAKRVPSGPLEGFEQQAQENGLWVAVFERSREVTPIAGVNLQPPSARMVAPILRGQVKEGQARSLRALDGTTWIYTWRAINADQMLLVAIQPPALPFWALLRDEFLTSFYYAGIVALVLAFLLALWLGGSIISPLRKMVVASRAVARGEYPSVAVEGPSEVRELAQAMNEMSQRVQAGQQSQRDFVANVSHELKTPLTSIQGFAQAILDGAAQTPEALQQSARVIYDEAARMHRLVLDLLSLARLEAGTADLQREPVNLPLLLRSVVDRLSPQAQHAQVSLTADLPDLPVIIGDGDRLAQVFTNLVDNALKFTPAGGQVQVSVRAEGGVLLASVVDSGAGIPLEDQSRIFERFYQVDRSRRGGQGRGIGLGLPIARQIVLAHGGKIWVESHPGQGSRFVVKLALTKSDDTTLVTRNKGKR